MNPELSHFKQLLRHLSVRSLPLSGLLPWKPGYQIGSGTGMRRVIDVVGAPKLVEPPRAAASAGARARITLDRELRHRRVHPGREPARHRAVPRKADAGVRPPPRTVRALNLSRHRRGGHGVKRRATARRPLPPRFDGERSTRARGENSSAGVSIRAASSRAVVWRRGRPTLARSGTTSAKCVCRRAIDAAELVEPPRTAASVGARRRAALAATSGAVAPFRAANPRGPGAPPAESRRRRVRAGTAMGEETARAAASSALDGE